jgi:hypothetical protein
MISGGIRDSKRQQDAFPRNPINYSIAEREVSPKKAAAGKAGLSALQFSHWSQWAEAVFYFFWGENSLDSAGNLYATATRQCSLKPIKVNQGLKVIRKGPNLGDLAEKKISLGLGNEKIG